MPKYGVHHIVLANAINGLQGSLPAVYNTLNQNNDIAMLGAIGPDLFFWAPDYPLVSIYQGIDEIITVYDDAVKPFRDIREAIGDEINTVVQDLLPATYAIIEPVMNSLEDTINLFQTTIATGMLSTSLGGINLLTEMASLPTLMAAIFNLFTPPRQSKPDEGEGAWYWFDMLHYRNTGDFARYLVENSSTARQRAYSFSYLSHIATDLTGHPYVNQIVGGPFRLHVQRHATVENFIDSWMFNEQYGESINKTLLKHLELPKGLPDDICELIHNAFLNTYSQVPHPPFLNTNEIHKAYDNMYKILELMERFDIAYPTKPFLDVNRILSEKLQDILEPPPSPPQNPTPSSCSWEDILSFGTTSNSKQCYDNFFKQLEQYFDYIGKQLEWLFETGMDVVDYLLASWASIPAKEFLAMLYGIQVFLYKIYQRLRYVLALEGLIYPEPKDLENAHGRNLTTTFQKCTPDLFEMHPLQTNLNVSHLVCPPCELDIPATAPDFNQLGSVNVTPRDFISNVPPNHSAFLSYTGANQPQDTYNLHRQNLRVGNATDLTLGMIKIAMDSSDADYEAIFTNFDLDADRGYFYKTWEGRIFQDRVENVRFI